MLIFALLAVNACSSVVADVVFGKPEIFHHDNYDECMLLKEEALYCSFTYKIEPFGTNESIVWSTIKAKSSDPYNYRHDMLRHAICVPITCPGLNKSTAHLDQGIKECYDSKFKSLQIHGFVSDLRCEGNDPEPPDPIDVAVAYLFAVYMALIVFVTVLDWNRILEPACGRKLASVLSAFSITRNWIRLKTIKLTPDSERLQSIQGVRTFNTVMIIGCHVILFNFMGPVANVTLIENVSERMSTAFFGSGPILVSTFFMISSWLVAYGLLDMAKNRKEIRFRTLFMVFVNRYIRLTPTLAVIIAFQSTWLRHLGNGPNWHHMVGKEFERCRKNWWTNLLYVHNYVDPENMCMYTTWYLALDTQYFPLMLLIVWCMKSYPHRTWLVVGVLATLSMTVAFYDNYVNDFPALMLPFPESFYDTNHTLKNKQWHIQYIGFLGNLAGPLVGVCFGYLYFRYNDRNIFTTKVRVYAWWIVANVVGYGIVMIPGILTLDRRRERSPFWASLHIATSRFIFASIIALGSFGLSHRIECYFKRFLEWRPLYVLGRLTYSAYLVHIPVVLYKTGVTRSPIYMNEFLIFLEVSGVTVVTYMAATFLTLCFEMPTLQLLKLAIVEKTNDPVKKK